MGNVHTTTYKRIKYTFSMKVDMDSLKRHMYWLIYKSSDISIWSAKNIVAKVKIEGCGDDTHSCCTVDCPEEYVEKVVNALDYLDNVLCSTYDSLVTLAMIADVNYVSKLIDAARERVKEQCKTEDKME